MERMQLKHELYAIGEAAALLSISTEEVHRLANEGLLSKRVAISAESILDLAARKKIELAKEAQGLEGVAVEKTKNVDASGASPDELAEVIAEALRNQFGQDAASGTARFSPVEIHSTHIIARGPGGKLHHIDYTNDESGVNFGAAQKVKETDALRSPMQGMTVTNK
jgi:hypothetical protein